MAKKHSKLEKPMDDVTGIECEDCGQEDCACDPCTDCGKMDCSCRGYVGGHGSCGPHGGGHGYGGWHGGWARKKMFVGFGLIVLAVLWYLKNVGTIPAALFWPIVFGLTGLALLIKGWWLKRYEDQCCGHC